MKFLRKVKAHIKEIHWPSKKSTIADTAFTIITTVILSVMIFGWVSALEQLFNLVVSLF